MLIFKILAMVATAVAILDGKDYLYTRHSYI